MSSVVALQLLLFVVILCKLLLLFFAWVFHLAILLIRNDWFYVHSSIFSIRKKQENKQVWMSVHTNIGICFPFSEKWRSNQTYALTIRSASWREKNVKLRSQFTMHADVKQWTLKFSFFFNDATIVGGLESHL